MLVNRLTMQNTTMTAPIPRASAGAVQLFSVATRGTMSTQWEG